MEPSALHEKSILVNRLAREWSASQFSEYLSSELLSTATRDFCGFSLGIRARILLSLLSLSREQLSKVWNNITDLLSVAQSDHDEWIRIVAGLVERRLPSQTEMGIPSADENFSNGITKKQSQEEDGHKMANALKTNHSNGCGDPLKEAIDEMAIGLELENFDDTTVPAQSSRALMVAEFFPVEYQFLCKELFPTSVELDDKNRHFQPLSSAQFGNRDISVASVDINNPGTGLEAAASISPAFPVSISPSSAGSNGSVVALAGAKQVSAQIQNNVKVVDPKKFKRKQAMVFMDTPSPADQLPAVGSIPRSVSSILADPANDLLTAESKAEVARFYTAYEGKPSTGEKLILLTVQQEQLASIPSQVKSTTTMLKLDYATKKASKTKKKQIITFEEDLTKNIEGASAASN